MVYHNNEIPFDLVTNEFLKKELKLFRQVLEDPTTSLEYKEWAKERIEVYKKVLKERKKNA